MCTHIKLYTYLYAKLHFCDDDSLYFVPMLSYTAAMATYNLYIMREKELKQFVQISQRGDCNEAVGYASQI